MAKDDEIAEGTTLLGNITLLLEDEGRGTGDHDVEKTKPGSQVDAMGQIMHLCMKHHGMFSCYFQLYIFTQI